MEISIIIPVYNTEKYIARCLDSVLSQTYQDFEIIVVNDCTPDNSMKIVRSYADPRIHIIEHKRNRGPMVARRTGYEAAYGNYLIFLDSDDSLPVNAIETLYENAIASNADIMIGGMQLVDLHDRIISQRHPNVDGIFDSRSTFELLLRRQIYHNLCAAMFKKELFRHEFYTIENQTNGEDLILFYQLVAKSNIIGIIKETVYFYLQNETSSTHTSVSKRKLDQYFIIQNFKYDFLIKQGFTKDRVVKFIVPVITEWLYFPYGRYLIGKLPDDLQEAIKIRNIYKNLPFAQATLSILICKFPFVIPLINGIKRSIHKFNHG